MKYRPLQPKMSILSSMTAPLTHVRRRHAGVNYTQGVQEGLGGGGGGLFGEMNTVNKASRLAEACRIHSSSLPA